MKIVNQWIVENGQHLVELKDGTFMLGSTTNVYGYERISNSDAFALINS